MRAEAIVRQSAEAGTTTAHGRSSRADEPALHGGSMPVADLFP
jgi:hypothetical protein